MDPRQPELILLMEYEKRFNHKKRKIKTVEDLRLHIEAEMVFFEEMCGDHNLMVQKLASEKYIKLQKRLLRLTNW